MASKSRGLRRTAALKKGKVIQMGNVEQVITQVKANMLNVQEQQKQMLLQKQENDAVIQQRQAANAQINDALQQSVGVLAGYGETLRLLSEPDPVTVPPAPAPAKNQPVASVMDKDHYAEQFGNPDLDTHHDEQASKDSNVPVRVPAERSFELEIPIQLLNQE